MTFDIDIYRLLSMFGVTVAGAFAVCYALIRGKLGDVFMTIDDCDSTKKTCDDIRCAEKLVTENYRKVIMDRFDKLEKTIDINFKYLLDNIIELKESK